MKKTEVMVDGVELGRYEWDTMFTTINGVDVQIVFRKEDKISKYVGENITLSFDGEYKITK